MRVKRSEWLGAFGVGDDVWFLSTLDGMESWSYGTMEGLGRIEPMRWPSIDSTTSYSHMLRPLMRARRHERICPQRKKNPADVTLTLQQHLAGQAVGNPKIQSTTILGSRRP